MEYLEFLGQKRDVLIHSGFEINEKVLNDSMFPFQKWIVKRALKQGKFAVFADCGLGKTLMYLEWARLVSIQTKKPVLCLTPLAVTAQTILEGVKFGIECTELTNKSPKIGVLITNYEQLHNIDCSVFSGVVLDESSILKNYSGATKQLILESFANTEFKLALTATPSPNDELEIGNHAEFLNICTSQDMRSIYFTTDKEIIKGNKYRLKNHSREIFYSWIASWAVMLSKPSDIGFEDTGYNLPGLNFIEKELKTEIRESEELFNSNSVSATTFNSELRFTKVVRM